MPKILSEDDPEGWTTDKHELVYCHRDFCGFYCLGDTSIEEMRPSELRSVIKGGTVKE